MLNWSAVLSCHYCIKYCEAVKIDGRNRVHIINITVDKSESEYIVLIAVTFFLDIYYGQICNFNQVSLVLFHVSLH